MRKSRLLLVLYCVTALLIFGAVAYHYHSRVAATVPTEEGIQTAIENGNISTVENVTIYDYATDTERYIVTVSEGNVGVLYENRDTEIAVQLQNGEKVETMDMRYMRSQVRKVYHLSQEQWMGILGVVVLCGVVAFLAYGFRLRKD